MSVLETRKSPTMPAPSSPDNPVHCKVCAAPFKTLQDCLGHELLKHTIKPQKKLRKCLDAITKVLANKQIQGERRELQAALAQAQLGQHLSILVAFYAADCNVLSSSFFEVRESLQKLLQNKVRVYPFGSLVTGLSLKDSDIDLFLEPTDTSSECPPLRQLFKKTNNNLRSSHCFKDVFAIRHARVPIIRCKHVRTNLSLDISMTSPKSTHNSRFFAELLNRDVRIRELFLFLKIWAKKLNIIGNGSMSSYCLMTLIIYGMQQQRQLPSIKQLQVRCEFIKILGINFGFSLKHVRPLPASLTTLDLISNFFELYSQMDFDGKLLSPYLGYALDVKTTFVEPGNFPDYEAQLLDMKQATGEEPEPFQYQRCVCVQDPFELQHNVGQSISQTNLCYIRECFVFAAQACNDKKLRSTPAKLCDYLLFGLLEKLLQTKRLEQAHPAKQRKQAANKTETVKAKPAAESAAVEAAEPAVVQTVEPAAEIIAATANPSPTGGSSENPLPLMHVHTLVPTNNDVKSLRAEFLRQNRNLKHTIFYYWAKCNVIAIKDIISNIYAIDMKLIYSDKPNKSNEMPRYLTWQINTKLDTWTARNFQRTASKQSFFAQQMQQTAEFLKKRPQSETYLVNLSGQFSLIISEDYKELRIELQPMSGNVRGLQRQSPLTKFFKSIKNICSNYNFKEKLTLQFENAQM